jgi:hypothetical protein
MRAFLCNPVPEGAVSGAFGGCCCRKAGCYCSSTWRISNTYRTSCRPFVQLQLGIQRSLRKQMSSGFKYQRIAAVGPGCVETPGLIGIRYLDNSKLLSGPAIACLENGERQQWVGYRLSPPNVQGLQDASKAPASREPATAESGQYPPCCTSLSTIVPCTNQCR